MRGRGCFSSGERKEGVSRSVYRSLPIPSRDDISGKPRSDRSRPSVCRPMRKSVTSLPGYSRTGPAFHGSGYRGECAAHGIVVYVVGVCIHADERSVVRNFKTKDCRGVLGYDFVICLFENVLAAIRQNDEQCAHDDCGDQLCFFHVFLLYCIILSFCN